MIILGIDPGSQITGYGVIRYEDRRCTYVASGCIRTQSKDLPDRLLEISQGLEQIIQQYQPEAAALEESFVHRYPRAALVLGHVRGVALLALLKAGLRVGEYAPRRIKQAVVGYGSATKEQVQHMVAQLLQLEGVPGQDAADALAVAMCHIHTEIEDTAG